MPVKYEQDYDPSMVERCVIFLKTGSFARMVKRTEILKDRKIRFFLVPTQAMIVKLGLDERKKEDTTKGVFNSIDGHYIKDIPEDWIQWIDNDPTTLRCFAYCDWNVTEFFNPARDKLDAMERLLRSVQLQRDSYSERIASLERALGKAGKYGHIHRKEVFDEISREQSKINPLVNPQGNQQGGQQ